MFLSKDLHFVFSAMHNKNWLNRPKSDILRLFLQLHNLVLLNLITEDNDKIPENEALLLTHVFKSLGPGRLSVYYSAGSNYNRVRKY